MVLWLKTALARRKIRRTHQRRGRWLPVCLLAVLLVLLPVKLRPKLMDYAENAVQYQATRMMEQAVAQCTEEMTDIGQTHTNADGTVTALSTDTAAVNRLRTRIVRQVYEDIGALENARGTVALGTLIDPQYLAGVGPQIPFGVVALGQVTAQVNSDFSASGINQTIYELTIRVNADFSLQAMGQTKQVTISAEYPLEETIIVGDVPLIAAESR